MKKIALSLALISLIAAGCNKNSSTSNNTSQTSQSNVASSENLNNNSDQSQVPAQSQAALNPGGNSSDAESGSPAQDNDLHYSDGSDIDAENAPEVVEIDITASGFSPKTTTIKKGDYLWFVNKDTVNHWPISDSSAKVLTIDSAKALVSGQNYRVEMLQNGTFNYHDKLNSSLIGTATVK